MSWVFFVLGGIAAASALQKLYQHVFQLPSQGLPDRLWVLAWLACACGFISLVGAVGHGLSGGLPALWWITNIGAIIAFWWLTMWLLLAGRLPWSTVMPCAVDTGSIGTGMLVVFHTHRLLWHGHQR